MGGEYVVSLGEITRVELMAGVGIFLDLDLQTAPAGDGTPVQARARWCPPYAGAGYGDWHLPDVGRKVLVAFPHGGPHRAAHGDIDHGYAFAYASFADAPPVATVDAGPISASQRALRGKTGVAEQRETGGVFKWFFRAAATFVHDALLRFQGPDVEFACVNFEVTASSSVDMLCAVVRAGDGSLTRYRLLDERAIPMIIGHVHSGVQTGGGNSGPPTTTIAVVTHTTTHQTSS